MGLPLPEVEPCWWENGMIASPPSALNMGGTGRLERRIVQRSHWSPAAGSGLYLVGVRLPDTPRSLHKGGTVLPVKIFKHVKPGALIRCPKRRHKLFLRADSVVTLKGLPELSLHR